MSDKVYVLPAEGNITVSVQAAELLISSGSGDGALLYIYILKNSGSFSSAEARAALGWDQGRIDAALSVLGGLGLIRSDVLPKGKKAPPPVLEPADEPPEYTAADISRAIDGGSGFGPLIKEVQRRLGRVLSPSDLTTLFGIYDYLKLPPEVVLTLVTYCMEQCRRKYGPGRLPTMRNIEKTAYSWSRQGISTLEQAEEHIKKLDARQSQYGEMKKVLNIRDRDLTATETRYVDSWCDMGYSPEAVSIAYDKTVFRTGKLNWKYMDSIIKSWYGKNLLTPAEIEAGDRKPGADGRPNRTSPTTAGPTDEEYLRMQRLLQKIKEQ